MVQEKLADAQERAEQLEREKADAVRLAALRGRAVDAQAAALRAAEAALARKRGALAQAEEAALAAQAALAHSQADREAVDTQVASLSGQYLR